MAKNGERMAKNGKKDGERVRRVTHLDDSDSDVLGKRRGGKKLKKAEEGKKGRRKAKRAIGLEASESEVSESSAGGGRISVHARRIKGGRQTSTKGMNREEEVGVEETFVNCWKRVSTYSKSEYVV
jgi:hypothetical protein